MFGHLALFVCCFNFMDFAESTWVDNSAEYKNDRTLRRDVSTGGINVRNYWMRSTIRARKTLDMHKMTNEAQDQASELENLLLYYDPLKGKAGLYFCAMDNNEQ